MKLIKDERFGLERALYNSRNVTIENCRFEGEEDGESALKECSNIVITTITILSLISLILLVVTV